MNTAINIQTVATDESLKQISCLITTIITSDNSDDVKKKALKAFASIATSNNGDTTISNCSISSNDSYTELDTNDSYTELDTNELE